MLAFVSKKLEVYYDAVNNLFFPDEEDEEDEELDPEVKDTVCKLFKKVVSSLLLLAFPPKKYKL